MGKAIGGPEQFPPGAETRLHPNLRNKGEPNPAAQMKKARVEPPLPHPGLTGEVFRAGASTSVVTAFAKHDFRV